MYFVNHTTMWKPLYINMAWELIYYSSSVWLVSETDMRVYVRTVRKSYKRIYHTSILIPIQVGSPQLRILTTCHVISALGYYVYNITILSLCMYVWRGSSVYFSLCSLLQLLVELLRSITVKFKLEVQVHTPRCEVKRGNWEELNSHTSTWKNARPEEGSNLKSECVLVSAMVHLTQEWNFGLPTSMGKWC